MVIDERDQFVSNLIRQFLGQKVPTGQSLPRNIDGLLTEAALRAEMPANTRVSYPQIFLFIEIII
jgi:hypothetical protein